MRLGGPEGDIEFVTVNARDRAAGDIAVSAIVVAVFFAVLISLAIMGLRSCDVRERGPVRVQGVR